MEEVENVQMVGTKRKKRVSRKEQTQVSRKEQTQVSRKRTFLDDEAQLSGEDDDDDSDSDGSDVEGLIDDSSDVEMNNVSFYRAADNNVSDSKPGPSTALQAPPPPPPTATLLTHEQEEVERKGLKKIKAFLSKLLTYIGQITILGFNSQKYDIPLIRPYLPSTIIKHDGTPKKKFLDITNYLAAETSVKAFYESYCESTPKGVFLYSWFDSLEKWMQRLCQMISRCYVIS